MIPIRTGTRYEITKWRRRHIVGGIVEKGLYKKLFFHDSHLKMHLHHAAKAYRFHNEINNQFIN